MDETVKALLALVIGAAVGYWVSQRSLPRRPIGSVMCWFGLHWWIYHDHHHRSCVRAKCCTQQKLIEHADGELWVNL